MINANTLTCCREAFGRKLRAICLRDAVNQDELAGLVGISVSSIENHSAGRGVADSSLLSYIVILGPEVFNAMVRPLGFGGLRRIATGPAGQLQDALQEANDLIKEALSTHALTDDQRREISAGLGFMIGKINEGAA